MHREPRIWGCTLAIYILMVATLQLTIYLASPKERYRTCTGWYSTGPAGKHQRYIDAYYLHRDEDGFVLVGEGEFIESVTSTVFDPVGICVADVEWFERTSIFDRLSMFSISHGKKEIVGFSAREGSMGEYVPIDPAEYSKIQASIAASAEDPGFVQAGTLSIAVRQVDPMIFAFKLLVYWLLARISYRITPSIVKAIMWWLTPKPTRTIGECMHCSYSTDGLTTRICPECGEDHGDYAIKFAYGDNL